MRNMGGMALGAAALVFAASAVVFGATVVKAVWVEEVLVPGGLASPPGQGESAGLAVADAPPSNKSDGFPRRIIYPQVTNDEILDAVNQDLFQPHRTPPLERYLLPSERVAPVGDPRGNRRRRGPNLRIVGTAIAGELALALVQLEDSIPFAVLLGEEVEGYMVAVVDEESVTFTVEGAEFTFPVVEPQRNRRSNNRNSNTRNQSNARELDAALQQRVQQMLQGLQRGQMQRGGQGQMPVIRELVIRPGGGGGGGGGSLS